MECDLVEGAEDLKKMSLKLRVCEIGSTSVLRADNFIPPHIILIK